MRRHAMDRRAVDTDGPASGREEPGDGTEGRRLSGAVRPDERHHLALPDPQAHSPQGLHGPVEDVDVLDFQHQTLTTSGVSGAPPRYAATTSGSPCTS